MIDRRLIRLFIHSHLDGKLLQYWIPSLCPSWPRGIRDSILVLCSRPLHVPPGSGHGSRGRGGRGWRRKLTCTWARASTTPSSGYDRFPICYYTRTTAVGAYSGQRRYGEIGLVGVDGQFDDCISLSLSLSLSLIDLTNKEETMFLEKSKNARKMMSRNGKL